MRSWTLASQMCAVVVLLVWATAPEKAEAVTYGLSDCSYNEQTQTEECDNPNVVMLSGKRKGEQGTRFSCSGTLVAKDIAGGQERYWLFLTAAHCISSWIGGLNSGLIEDVGVSFQPHVDRIYFSNGGFTFNPAEYAWGGRLVAYPGFNPNQFVWDNDWGFVAFNANAFSGQDENSIAARAAWPVLVASDLGLKLDALVAQYRKPQKDLTFFAVGYGQGEFLNFGTAGFGSNAYGWSDARFNNIGNRRVAPMQTYDNLRSSILQTSQNPALGNDGTCYGDSGGPTYFSRPSGPVQVGVTSSGDYVCRAAGTYARTDTPEFAEFLACGRANPHQLHVCGIAP